MSILKQEIMAQLSPMTRGAAGELLFGVTFPSQFSGFKGHFPGRPVLPGVCMVQTALVALGVYHGKAVRLRQLVTAKWLLPVAPQESLDYVMRPDGELTGLMRVKVSVTRQAERIAEFTLEVTGSSAGGAAV